MNEVCPRCKKPYIKRQVKISFNKRQVIYVHREGRMAMFGHKTDSNFVKYDNFTQPLRCVVDQ